MTVLRLGTPGPWRPRKDLQVVCASLQLRLFIPFSLSHRREFKILQAGWGQPEMPLQSPEVGETLFGTRITSWSSRLAFPTSSGTAHVAGLSEEEPTSNNGVGIGISQTQDSVVIIFCSISAVPHLL